MNSEQIVNEWTAFAATLVPASDFMSPLALRNHIREMLDFVVVDMESKQTPLEEHLKSQGRTEKQLGKSASEIHAASRLAGGFNIKQMVSEFRALRASVTRLWAKSHSADRLDAADVTRFNEAIDQIVSETVSFYTDEVRKTHDLFVGIVGHDLRSPVQSVMGCAELLPLIGSLNDRQAMLCRQISESSTRITGLLDDLTDLTRARTGGGLAILPVPMDAAFVTRQIVAEVRVSHPAHEIRISVTGSPTCVWDKARFGQLVANLLGNAVQYGFHDTPIDVALDGSPEETVSISIHNSGVPIPPGKIATLFEPMNRAGRDDGPSASGAHLGLGLFIAKDIVKAHRGSLHVTSTEEGGTTFTATMPRQALWVRA